MRKVFISRFRGAVDASIAQIKEEFPDGLGQKIRTTPRYVKPRLRNMSIEQIIREEIVRALERKMHEVCDKVNTAALAGDTLALRRVKPWFEENYRQIFQASENRGDPKIGDILSPWIYEFERVFSEKLSEARVFGGESQK